MFAVLAQGSPVKIAEAIKNKFPNDHFELTPGQWFVNADGTARELSDKLGVTDGATGGAVIVHFSSYYGRANNQIWEWLASKMGSPTRG